MLTFQFRPTSRMLSQIARLERLAGQWDRLSESHTLASPELREQVLLSAIEASSSLDTTVLDGGIHRKLAKQIELEVGDGESSSIKLALAPYEALLEAPIELSKEALSYALDLLLNPELSVTSPKTLTPSRASFRTGNTNFFSPSLEGAGEEIVFSAIPAFLIQQRLSELIEWVNLELRSRTYHPLVIIGTFHLSLLQTAPFQTANHRLCLLWDWKLLRENGYSLVDYGNFIPIFQQRSRSYFSALRQAEKSAGGNWSTLNIWLEFFFESLALAAEELVSDSLKRTDADHLTTAQKQILELVKNHGAATREAIARQTGLNVSTVKYNLSVLSEKGHLQRHGGGRSTSYSVN